MPYGKMAHAHKFQLHWQDNLVCLLLLTMTTLFRIAQTYTLSFLLSGLFLLISVPIVFSQQLEIFGIDEQLSNTYDIQLDYTCNDSSMALILLQPVIGKLQNLRYFEAELDSITTSGDSFAAHINTGPRYTSAGIQQGNIPTRAIQESRIRIQQLTEDYHPKQSAEAIQKLLRFYADQGYPLASLRLDSIGLDQTDLIGSWNLQPGKQILFDSIQLTGNTKTKPYFINRLTRIRRSDPFSMNTVDAIETTLNKLKYLTLNGDPELLLFDKWCTVKLPIDDVNNSKFDLLFGVIPTEAIEGRTVFLSADLFARLQNKLGFGEFFVFDFEKLRPENQKLQIHTGILYPFDLPFGIDVKFDIFRRSLDFFELNLNSGVYWPVTKNTTLHVFNTLKSHRLIEIDTEQLLQSKKLPNTLDSRHLMGGIAVEIQTIKNTNNPRHGVDLRSEIRLGQKKLIPNIQIQGVADEFVDFSTSYDTLNVTSFISEYNVKAAQYLALGANSALKIGMRSQAILAQQTVLKNELIRIGGSQTLRGFDEEQFFSQWIVQGMVEYRLLIGENSHITLPFIEYSVFNTEQKASNRSIGIGGGISLETRAGLLNLSLAVAKFNENAFNITQPKVHIGFNNVF